MKFETTLWDNQPAIRITEGSTEALVLLMGANVISLKAPEMDILRTPKDNQQLAEARAAFGIPLLFPPNRIENGTFTKNGKTYNYPINSENNNHIHGFLMTAQFEAIEKEDCLELVYKCTADTEVYKYIEHEFTARLEIRLFEDRLNQIISITNDSDAPMPLGFAFHTAFKTPFCQGTNGNDYRLTVETQKVWELDYRIMPTGESSAPPAQWADEGIPCQGQEAMLVTSAVSREGKLTAIIKDSKTGSFVKHIVDDGFKFWVLWNDDGKGEFFCAEPQTWLTNAPNLDLPDEVTGYQEVFPRKTWKQTSDIIFYHA